MTSSPEPFTALDLPELTAPGTSRASSPVQFAPDGMWTLPELHPNASNTRPYASPRSADDESYDRGHAEGLAEGAKAAEGRIRPALDALERVVAFLDGAQLQFSRDRARNVHSLALAVAQKLVQREIVADPTIVSALIAQALELLPLDSSIEVRLNPEDLAALSDEIERFVAPARVTRLTWVADLAIERGSFLVESPMRIVDGRADVALRTLYERLGDE